MYVKSYLRELERFIIETKDEHSINVEYLKFPQPFYCVSEYYDFESYLVENVDLGQAVAQAFIEREKRGW